MNSIHEKASKDFINSLKKSEEKLKLYIDDIKPTLEKVQTEFKNKNEEIIVDLKQKIKEVIETSTEKINEIKGLDLLKEINSIESYTCSCCCYEICLDILKTIIVIDMWSNFLNNSNIVYIKESLEYFDKGYHTIENVLN